MKKLTANCINLLFKFYKNENTNIHTFSKREYKIYKEELEILTSLDMLQRTTKEGTYWLYKNPNLDCTILDDLKHLIIYSGQYDRKITSDFVEEIVYFFMNQYTISYVKSKLMDLIKNARYTIKLIDHNPSGNYKNFIDKKNKTIVLHSTLLRWADLSAILHETLDFEYNINSSEKFVYSLIK
jgi:hypothetical protein